MKINSFKKVDFIQSKQLLYTQKIGTYKEDELFNVLILDHKLKNPFDFQMAFLKHSEIYHCFLTPVSKLKKSSFCFPEPLIFQALFDENLIKENNFCVLNLYDEILYLYFYEEGKLSGFKTIQNFNLNNVQFFLEQNRFKDLLKHYGSKLILHCNLSEIKNCIFSEIQCLNLKHLLGENSFLKLSSYSMKYLDQNCNFIKENKIKIPFYIKIILLFILSFSLSMAVLLFKDFIKYKQNQAIKHENLIMQEESSKLGQEKEELLARIQDLNLTLEREIFLAQEQGQILSSIIHEITLNKKKSPILKHILSWLDANELKITYLQLSESKIILIFSDENNFKLALKYLDLNFKILHKDEDNYKITLEIIHG